MATPTFPFDKEFCYHQKNWNLFVSKRFLRTIFLHPSALFWSYILNLGYQPNVISWKTIFYNVTAQFLSWCLFCETINEQSKVSRSVLHFPSWRLAPSGNGRVINQLMSRFLFLPYVILHPIITRVETAINTVVFFIPFTCEVCWFCFSHTQCRNFVSFQLVYGFTLFYFHSELNSFYHRFWIPVILPVRACFSFFLSLWLSTRFTSNLTFSFIFSYLPHLLIFHPSWYDSKSLLFSFLSGDIVKLSILFLHKYFAITTILLCLQIGLCLQLLYYPFQYPFNWLICLIVFTVILIFNSIRPFSLIISLSIPFPHHRFLSKLWHFQRLALNSILYS